MVDYLWLILLIVVILGVVFDRAWRDLRNDAPMDAARVAYDAALAALRADPTNTAAYQHALDCGRAYAALTRKASGMQPYDETAIQNDLTAARGAR